jgi:hypothetical protein
MKYLIFLILFLPGCAIFKEAINPYAKVEAKVESVSPKGIIKTNKGTYICGNCVSIIKSQKTYIFYLEGNKIQKMSEK